MNAEETHIVKAVIARSTELLDLVDKIQRDSFVTGFIAGCVMSIFVITIIRIFMWD